MPAFTASAPGKIILFGEHAVVYGQTALAVPVTQVKAQAIVSPNIRHPESGIHIIAPVINLDHPLADLKSDHPIAIAINGVLKVLQVQRPPACTIRINSEIPVAAGLGSGAAVSVATIRSFAAFLGAKLPDETVNKLAFEVEKQFHGTPSGIDNTVITYAKPVYYKKGKSIKTLQVQKSFKILIADTGVSVPTRRTVGSVRKAWEENKSNYNRIFEEIGNIAEDATHLITTGQIEGLGNLMNENQMWLREIKVSSRAIETLIKAALEAGASGAKLSGGGKGGNIIAFAPDHQLPRIQKALQSAGAVRIITTEIRKS